MNLTISDGFKLGCGLLLALAFAAAVLILLVSFAVLVSSVLGNPLHVPGT